MTFVIFSTLEIRFLYSDPSESSVWWLCNSQDLAFEETELPSQAGKIKRVWREGFWGTLVPKTCVLWWGAWTDACTPAIHSLVKRSMALCSSLEGSRVSVAKILSLVVGFCMGFTSAKATRTSFSVGWQPLPEEPNFSQWNCVFLPFKNTHFFCFGL